MQGASEEPDSPDPAQANQEDLLLKQCYRQIGDQIEAVLNEIPLTFSYFALSEPSSGGALYALTTLFQFVEQYSDMQAAETLAASASIQQEPGFVGLDLYREYAKIYTALRRTRSPDDVAQVEISLGASIGGLLEEVKRLGQSKLEHLPEFLHLRQVWRQHYTPSEASGFRHASKSWQPVDCRDCPLGSQLGYWSLGPTGCTQGRPGKEHWTSIALLAKSS
jgi:hypothetical protein